MELTANIEPATLDIKVKSWESVDPQESVKRTQMYASEILFCFLKKTTTVIYMCFTPDARGIEFLFCPQNFKMITSAKHEGYISVWARVRSMRVPNIIHHEGRGC